MSFPHVAATIYATETTAYARYTINGEDAGFASDAWAHLVDAYGLTTTQAEGLVQAAAFEAPVVEL